MTSRSFALLALVLSAAPSVALANQTVLVSDRNASVEFNVYYDVAFTGLGVGDDSFDLSWRALLSFDLASIPPGSRVNSVEVTLRLGSIDQVLGVPGTLILRRGLTPWLEGQTALCSPWPCGGAFVPVVSSTTTAWTPLGSPATFPSTTTLVADVQGWVDQPATNHGWFLDTTTPLFFASFHDRSSATPPLITIDWDPPCPAPTTYCAGAPNSVGVGASIASSGSARISDADFGLVVTGCGANTPGFFFFGPGQQQIPWGDGLLCVDGPFQRLLPAVFANPQGTAVRPISFATGPGTILTPGSTWNFQYKYRDIVTGGTGFNSSNALSATFCP